MADYRVFFFSEVGVCMVCVCVWPIFGYGLVQNVKMSSVIPMLANHSYDKLFQIGYLQMDMGTVWPTNMVNSKFPPQDWMVSQSHEIILDHHFNLLHPPKPNF